MTENITVAICVVMVIILTGYLLQDIVKSITIKREVKEVIKRCENKCIEVEMQLERTHYERKKQSI